MPRKAGALSASPISYPMHVLRKETSMPRKKTTDALPTLSLDEIRDLLRAAAEEAEVTKELAKEETLEYQQKLSYLENDVHAWEKSQAEVEGLRLFVDLGLLKLGELDPDTLLKVIEGGKQETVAEIEATESKREASPYIQLARTLEERERQAKAQADAKFRKAIDAAQAEMEAFNSSLLAEAKQDGRWGTWAESAKSLVKKGILDAHKGLEKGVKAPWGDVHKAFAKRLEGLLADQGFKQMMLVDETRVDSKSFFDIVRELADLVDPRPQYNRTAQVTSTRRPTSNNKGKGKGKARKDDQFATFYEKPAVDVPSVAEVNAALSSEGGETMEAFFDQSDKEKARQEVLAE
jgi:hypothetical protein